MEVARRWGEVLGCESRNLDGGAAIDVDGGVVHFVPLRDERGEGICGFEVAIPGAQSREMDVGGVRVVVEPTRA
jgi:hypothetical protein